MAVNFTDEGPGRNPKWKFDWPNIVSTLKSRPGKWAEVTGENTSLNHAAVMATAERLKRGSIAEAPRGEFDATVRGTTVYARYVGPNREYADDNE